MNPWLIVALLWLLAAACFAAGVARWHRYLRDG